MTVQAELMQRVLQNFKGNQTHAAAALGISVQAVNNYVLSKRVADDACIIAMCDFLGENTQKMLAAHREETARTDRERSFWHNFGKAAALVVLLGGITSEQSAQVPSFDRVTGLMHIMFGCMLHRVITFARVSFSKLYRIASVQDSAPSLLA